MIPKGNAASTLDGVRLFSGRCHPELAKKIATHLNVPLGKADLRTFPDGEMKVQIKESVRRNDVFIVQPTCRSTNGMSVNDTLMELLVMVDALKRASAGWVTAVIPYYGYGRQDRKATGRDPISARLIADMITNAGANRVVAVDLHATQIQGFFEIPVDHLTGTTTIADYLKTLKLERGNAVIVSPDTGGAKRTKKYARLLGLGFAILNKNREDGHENDPETERVVGDVEGKTAIVVDDMITTAGTITSSIDELEKAGATSCIVAATHGILAKGAIERLQDKRIKEVVTTDTVPIPKETRMRLPKLRILSLSSLLAEVIQTIAAGESVSEIFEKRGLNQVV